MKWTTIAGAVLALSFCSTSAQAQPVDEILEEVNGSKCVAALKSCKDDKIGQAWKGARKDCAALRSCKKDCRAGKRGAKKEARGDKRDCKKACKGKKGKAKRQCKKECRQDFRGDKKDARKGKRDCTKVCRAEWKTPECKAARGGLVKALANCAKKAGGPCAKELAEKIGD